MRPEFVISLLALALCGLAHAQEPASETARATLGDVHIFALAEPDLVALDWRALKAGVEPPQVTISGADMRPVVSLPYAERAEGLTAAILIGGSQAEDLSWQITLARTLAASLRGTGSEVLVYAGGDHVILLGESLSEAEEELDALFNSLAEEAGRLAGPLDATALAGVIADLDGRDRPVGQRIALMAPAASFPAGVEARSRLTRLSLQSDMALFPMSNDPVEALSGLASTTGGAEISRGFRADTSEMEALTAPLRSGGALAFEPPAGQRYRLPGERARPLVLTISAGGAEQELVLRRETPVLTGGALAMAFIDPRYWASWLSTPGRQVAGAGGLMLWLIALGLLALVVRGVMRRRPERAEERPVFSTGGDISVGRRSGNRLVLAHVSVSREHALLKDMGEGRYQLVDLGSSNGTFIGRGPVWEAVSAPLLLASDDRLRFGEVVMTLREILVQATASKGEAGEIARFNRPRRNPYTGQIEEGGS